MKRAAGSPGRRVFKPAEIIVASAVRPGARLSDVREVCSEALKNGIRSICVPSVYVDEAAIFIGDTGLKLSTMISFPTGLMPVDLKMMEMRLASEHGVEEVYFYPNLGNYLDSRIVEFESELSRVVEESQLIGLKNVKPVVEADLVSGKQFMEIAGILEAFGFDTMLVSSGFGLKTIGPGVLDVLNAIGETMMVEAHCRLGSLRDLRSLVENRVCKVLTVDYGVVSEEASDRRLEE